MSLAEKVYLHALSTKNASEYTSNQAGAIGNTGNALPKDYKPLALGAPAIAGAYQKIMARRKQKNSQAALNKPLRGTNASINKNKSALLGTITQGVVPTPPIKVYKRFRSY